MSNSSISIKINIAFNIISGIIDIFALVVCLGLLCAIIYRLIRIKHNRRIVITDVPLMLSTNIICIIFLKSNLQLTHVTIPTLIKDFHSNIKFEDTPTLRYRAYVLWVMVGVLNWSYTLLAFFRFVRVVYPTKLWLHRPSLYLYVLIPGQAMFVSISLLPVIFVFDGFHQIPNEAYSSILPEPLYSYGYLSTITFIASFHMMCLFYFLIARKMRQTTVLRQNLQFIHRRDILVFRRMAFTMFIIGGATIPFGILYLIGYISNHFDSLTYRIQWLSSSLSSCLFSCILPLITTQLQDLLRPNRVVAINTNT